MYTLQPLLHTLSITVYLSTVQYRPKCMHTLAAITPYTIPHCISLPSTAPSSLHTLPAVTVYHIPYCISIFRTTPSPLHTLPAMLYSKHYQSLYIYLPGTTTSSLHTLPAMHYSRHYQSLFISLPYNTIPTAYVTSHALLHTLSITVYLNCTDNYNVAKIKIKMKSVTDHQ